jgi:hypothetical protein
MPDALSPFQPFHIIILADGLRLARAPDTPWQALQNQFPTFVTSLGPMGAEAMLDLLFEEWPELTWREAEIRAWASGEVAEFDLEGPALR